ncbi:MAG: DNA polymerase III subunit gamma/tau, partial [Kordiimonas sp.]
AANMPAPADLMKKIQGQPAGGATPGGVPAGGASGATAIGSPAAPKAGQTRGATAQPSAQGLAFNSGPGSDHAMHPMPIDLEKLVALFNKEKEPSLAILLKDHTHLVSYKPGAIEINITRQTPADFIMRVKACLKHWTGTDWTITISKAAGDATIRDQEVARDKKRKDEALQEPIVKALLASFPDAELLAVRDSRLEDEGLGGDMPTDPDVAVGDDETADFDF